MIRNSGFIILMAILLLEGCQKKDGIIRFEKGKYLQEIKSDVQLPVVNPPSVLRLIRQKDKITAITKDTIFEFHQNRWTTVPLTGGWQAAATDTRGSLWLATSGMLLNVDDHTQIELPQKAKNDSVNCLLWDNGNILHAGTNNGLWTLNGSWKLVPGTEGNKVRQLIKGAGDEMWAATSGGLFHRKDGGWLNLDEYVMAPGLLHNYFSFSAGASPGDVIFGSKLAVSQISANGNHWNFTGEDGLPIGPVTSICRSGSELWLGTPEGAIRKDDTWHYYHGKRWLPDNKINDIMVVDPYTVWIATPKGISEIKKTEMTLEQKAVRFEKRLNDRHLHHGFSAICRFSNPGDTTQWKCFTDYNDGLWTSVYLAAESFRYAATGSEDAYNNAVRTFEAMEKLETITSVPGFVARSYVSIDEDTGRGGEWHVTSDGKWKWKGDTSSDEIVGHMFAYPIFYELAAKGEMKERVKNLVNRLMTHIVDNRFRLIDLDGMPTRWGVWCPDSLNHSPDWMYEKGINSLQILSFLESAFFVTGDKKFEEAYLMLIRDHHYDVNMVQQKMYTPFEINHSDDELSYLPYYCLLRYVRDPELKKTYQQSIARSWAVEQLDRIPLWNIITTAGLGKDCDLEVAINELQDYPMDIIHWTMENSQRWDLHKNPVADRFLKAQATKPVPVDERGITKWNSNTYQFDYGGSGMSEDDGAAWLLPYWMARYHRFIVETKN
jgi:hypothetical protein